MSAKIKIVSCGIVILVLLSPFVLYANDVIEGAGVGIGLTAGNMWFVPAKGITAAWGLTAGAFSFLLSGGNWDLTQQIWRDATEEPYLITPSLAQRAIGERPELELK